MSKGLAIIYDPHNLYQFLWYYCTYGKNKKWDALCLPNGFRGQYMDAYCKKCGVFENIYSDDKDFLAVPLSQQLKIFLQMFGYAIIGQQKRFCRKFLNNYVNIDEYDEINVMTDVGLVSGLAVGLSSQKKVVITEDGVGDYEVRKYKNVFSEFFTLHTWKGVFLSLMGYSNIGHVFPLRTTKNCIKYSSHPEKMNYTKYYSHHKLYDFSQTDSVLFENIIKKTYDDINKYDLDSYDAILFTEPLEDYFVKPDLSYKLIEDYISNNTKRVLIKKHPREKWNYTFSDDVQVDVLDQSIPAEVLIPYLKNKHLIFTPSSSVMLYLDSDINNVSCLYLSKAFTQEQTPTILGFYPTKENLLENLKRYGIEKYRIIEI